MRSACFGSMAVIAGFLVLCATGCLPVAGETRPPFIAGLYLVGEYVVDGAAKPSAIAVAADGRIFYCEKNTGKIRVVSATGELLDAPFATVPVNYAGERGLLGIALHPRFDTTPRLYVFYSRSDTGAASNNPVAIVDHRVVYFTADGDVADGGEVFVFSVAANDATTRLGGRIGFAADRSLLIGLGDFGDESTAQNTESIYGKILRLNEDGSIPTDNPTPGSAIYARGVRNVGGMSVASSDGLVLFVDRNPTRADELNRVISGANYGWPAVAGRADTTTENEFVAANPAYSAPILDSGDDTTSFVGVSINPSGQYGPDRIGGVFFGEATGRRVRWGNLNSDKTGIVSTAAFATQLPSDVRDVAFSPAGTLFIACDDSIIRIRSER